MNKKKSDILYTEKVLTGISRYILYISLLAVPLYMPNGYFGLIEAKAKCYSCFVIPALLVSIILIVVNTIMKLMNKDPTLPVVRGSSVFFVCISGWALFSSYCSTDRISSFYGTRGWAMGSMMTVLLVACSWVISGHLKFNINLMLPVTAVNVPIFLMAIVQAAGIDLFHLLESIPPLYCSTIGQKNSFSGYLCLLLPLFWGFYAVCTTYFSKIIYAVFSLLGFLCIILCDSDSVYAGIGFACLFMIPFYLESAQKAKRAGELLLLFGLCQIFVSSFPIFESKISGMGDISKWMASIPCAAGVLTAGIILYFAARNMQRGHYEKVLKALVIVSETALVMVIALLVVYTKKHFNDSWGSSRGMIWRVTSEEFRKLSTVRKWIGVGPDLLAVPYNAIRNKMNINLLAAHSEPLQILLTQGITGFVLYLLFWGYLFFLYIKGKVWKEKRASFFFPLAAYFGQSLLCSVYPITGILYSVMVGIYLEQIEK